MKPLRLAFLFGSLILQGCAPTGGPADSKPERAAKPASIWALDASLANQLTNLATFGNYQISLPVDFVQQPAGMILGAVRTFTWKGPAGAEGQPPVLRITIQTDERGVDMARKDMRRSLETLCTSAADGSDIKIASWQKTESGVLDGLEFTRVRWTGSAEKVPVNGFAYGTLDGPSIITITAMNFGSDSAKANKLTESMVATFKKK